MNDSEEIGSTLPDDLLDAYEGARVLVLGTSGFIGHWVARHLITTGAEIHLIVRNEAKITAIPSLASIQQSFIQLDLFDLPTLIKHLKLIRPTVTFNLSGYGVDPSQQDESDAFHINTKVVQTLGEVLAEMHSGTWKGQHLVHAGSVLEYGTISGNLSEGSQPNPTTMYGRSKLAGTEALRQCGRDRGLAAVTARLATVYGPGEHDGRLMPSLLKAAESGQVLPLTEGHQQRDFTFVKDVAEGLLRLATVSAPPGWIINLVTGRLTTVHTFACSAAGILGIPLEQLKFGALPSRPKEMNHDPITTERLRQLTGWAPQTDIVNGIRSTAMECIEGFIPLL